MATERSLGPAGVTTGCSDGAMPDSEAATSWQQAAGPFACELLPHFLIIEGSTVDLLRNENV